LQGLSGDIYASALPLLHGVLTTKRLCRMLVRGLFVRFQVVTVGGVVGKNNGSGFIFAKTAGAQ